MGEWWLGASCFYTTCCCCCHPWLGVCENGMPRLPPPHRPTHPPPPLLPSLTSLTQSSAAAVAVRSVKMGSLQPPSSLCILPTNPLTHPLGSPHVHIRMSLWRAGHVDLSCTSWVIVSWQRQPGGGELAVVSCPRPQVSSLSLLPFSPVCNISGLGSSHPSPASCKFAFLFLRLLCLQLE